MTRHEWKRRIVQSVALGGGVAFLGVAGAVSAGAALARRAVTIDRNAETPVTVTQVRQHDGHREVWLRGEHSALPGKYSLVFDAGRSHARIGDVLEEREGAVRREVLSVERGELRSGVQGRITGWWFTEPEQLGFRVDHVTYPTELGEADAWVIHPRRQRKHRWAVHVHGRGAPPEETLRGVAPLARAGITSLVISYRNDPGAPRGENGRYGIGLAESHDVDAAIAEARRRGAERVTLFGWSMGGTATLIAATAGRHTSVIDGLILDSPAVDWAALLRYHAAMSHAPRAVANIGIRLLDSGVIRGGEPDGIDFTRLTPAAFAERLTIPVLIHASVGDTFVPCTGAQDLASARPDLVQLRLQPTGEHVKLWNVAPDPWERVTEAFARAIPRPAWRGEPVTE